MLVLQGRFTTVDLTEEEKQMANLNPFQIAVLQNERAAIAEDMMDMLMDPKQTIEFIQRQAELKGQLGMVETLLGKMGQEFFSEARVVEVPTQTP